MLTAALDAALYYNITNIHTIRYVCKQGMVAIIKSYYKTNLKSMLILWHIIYVFLEYACYVIRACMQEYSGAPSLNTMNTTAVYIEYICVQHALGLKLYHCLKSCSWKYIRPHYKCMCEKERH